MPSPTTIGVLGGGLTGISSAFHLSRRFPSASITLLESSPRLGGWVHSERVSVRDAQGNEARILLERGPRTLRPNGKSVLELVNLLGLSSSLLTVPKTSPAAQTRFLYIPGTNGLTALPSSLLSLFLTPLGRAITCAAVKEPFRFYRRPGSADADADEALEAFLARRLTPELARTLGSALVNGIYAGDSRELSVRAAFPSLWAIAQEGGGSIGRGLAWHLLKHALGLVAKSPGKGHELGDVEKLMEGVSVYSFRDGLGTIVRAVEEELERKTNVRVLKEEGAATLARSADGNIQVTTTKGNTLPFTHLVSAMPLPAVQSLLQRSSLPILPNLTSNPLSSIAVVNLIFPPQPSGQPIHPAGFGYLIPRAPDTAAPSSSLTVLGTVFDSCSLGAQDEYASPAAPRFTKMTMMLRLSGSSADEITPDSALALLTQHLAPRTPLPAPVFFRVHALRGCIAVPTVGHVTRTRELRDAVAREWGGRLVVVGAGVGGVSVPDCIEQGRQVGAAW